MLRKKRHTIMTFLRNLLKRGRFKSQLLMAPASPACDRTTWQLTLLGDSIFGVMSVAKLFWGEVVFLEEVPEGCTTLPGTSGSTDHVTPVICEELGEVGFLKGINDLLLGHFEEFKLGFSRA